MKSMEQYGIVHRDIKPDNLIVRKTLGSSSSSLAVPDICTICLIDFGVCTNLNIKRPHRDGCGTVGYMAPESIPKREIDIKTLKVTSKADMYSAGIIFYEMYARFTLEPSAAILSKEMQLTRHKLEAFFLAIEKVRFSSISEMLKSYFLLHVICC
jgi:serine/threonine protein kinase